MVYKQIKLLDEQLSHVKHTHDTYKRQIDVIAGRQQRHSPPAPTLPSRHSPSMPKHSPPAPTFPSVPKHSPPAQLQSNIRRFYQTHCENKTLWPRSPTKCACNLLKTQLTTRDAIQKVEKILKDDPKIFAIDLLRKVKAAEARSSWSTALYCMSRLV